LKDSVQVRTSMCILSWTKELWNNWYDVWQVTDTRSLKVNYKLHFFYLFLFCNMEKPIKWDPERQNSNWHLSTQQNHYAECLFSI